MTMMMLKSTAILLLLIAAMIAAMRLVRRHGAVLGLAPPASPRLRLVERLMLDGRTSALLLRYDGRDHLILLGNGSATAIADHPAPIDSDADRAAPPPLTAPRFSALIEAALRGRR